MSPSSSFFTRHFFVTTGGRKEALTRISQSLLEVQRFRVPVKGLEQEDLGSVGTGSDW